MLLKHILIITCLISMISLPAISQETGTNSTDGDPLLTPRTITLDKFNCFQTLQCLQKENPFKTSNLDKIRIGDQRSGNFVVEGSSKNESLYAVYNNSGELIKATVIQSNIPMPKAINEVLTTDEFESWRIIGNELVIENFDKERMQYKVIMQRDGEVRIEYLDRNGNFLNRIS